MKDFNTKLVERDLEQINEEDDEFEQTQMMHNENEDK